MSDDLILILGGLAAVLGPVVGVWLRSRRQGPLVTPADRARAEQRVLDAVKDAGISQDAIDGALDAAADRAQARADEREPDGQDSRSQLDALVGKR